MGTGSQARRGAASTEAEDELLEEGRVVRVERRQWRGSSVDAGGDWVAREEPLEIRIGGVPVAVVMRTPGHDEELVRGFLVSEGIVAQPREIGSVRHCTEVDDVAQEDNVVQVVTTVPVDVAKLRRNLYASSSCGICGKASIEQAMATASALEPTAGPRVSRDTLYALPARLRREQAVFERTGGLHAAALFTEDGSLRVVREDVGRHNAVDKAIGWAGQTAPDRGAADAVLLVSGRVSFEIVQKALAARIAVIAAVSAPTSLAVELARTAGITLVAFVRDETMSVYAGEQRVTS